MPTFRFAVTVAANTQVANAVAGSQFEFLGTPSVVQVYLCHDTAAGTVEGEIFFGQELEYAQAPLPVVAVGTGPVVPNDLVLDDVGAPNDRLVIRLIETAGVNTPVRGMVKITPIPMRR